ncbi:MAG: hypothetical protein NC305_00060 [Lachnospiraceae bacterium]|nr:hypothetical protein [Butyrivibrio sp.]MCM1343904.1 hypothetical protein [Muribaculaceae bacterium]MCM1408936.1 hypothetical protein [Lachnospiraceae bacterium]
MKKKAFSLVFASSLILSTVLTGCGGSPADSGSSAGSGSSQAAQASSTGGAVIRRLPMM